MIEYDWQEKINFKSARPTGRQKFFFIFTKNFIENSFDVKIFHKKNLKIFFEFGWFSQNFEQN